MAVVVGAEEFAERAEVYRRELLAHCYRMLGSVDDAEDVVQEIYVRAWRSYGGFEGRASLRTWLYRIATNACLSALGHRDRRYVPSGLGAPGNDPYAEVVLAGPEIRWVQPIPDSLADPAEVVAERNQLRLALIVSLQHLPPSQRAVLILREVLAFPAADVAGMLGISVAAVKSSLQRARARLAELDADGDEIVEPSDARAKALLDQYITAFENSDLAALERALRADTVLEFTPSRTWFAGLTTCLPYFESAALGSPGDWRMTPLRANGQPAAAAYRRTASGSYEAFGIAVLTVSTDGIARITVFGDPGLFAAFGLPSRLV
ncbi:RNA polymerase sigma-70 factor (ECF subfamily) [Kribbella sp. VKM Ac-2527]|uniref:RNA polymerase sigma-70 factor (ECF subfamily) n=1 Tax=Kribbella caucasensis TaxID=2512215 RepID=A0A4R6K9I1_9ACTN|nr:sigma-70 family RNA polymerase sigma factor [Kribbella sp. VKM Ac-2527]TDO46333.1 RNA polymerase sigma-70 factor (ECF subfamily) [Kribbella sp. VKM Ac-2527]